ncbi:PREDICTED: cystathionine gamma-lyase-like [Acropora digitifera]|uniref:cystathionine gamma-lyase-like n=1 Tax=Acropora digitifera TaxID=70779 RepID=UPI00077A0E1A|nr:PREDICTED: cystathionine gamma-lyase-like [Acropora digitifera]
MTTFGGEDSDVDEERSDSESSDGEGLESYPQLELAKKQMTGFGGMVTFFMKGDVENSKQFFKASKVRLCFVLCVNVLLYEAEKRLVVETQIVALSLT